MFHIGDYHKDTAHLTSEEDLAYRRLLDLYYDTESPIPLDIAPIARRIRCQPQVVENVLKEFFKPSEAGWINKRADKEIAQYKSYSTNGKKGAAIRWGKPSEDSPPIAPPIATNNHKPISNNHKLEITNHVSKVTNTSLDTSVSNIPSIPNIVEEEIAPPLPPHSPPIGRLLPPHEGAKAWAYRLRQREEAGEQLTLAQKRNWREALRVGL